MREKAHALVHLARGATYREAARRARSWDSGRFLTISSDGRMAGDWVSMYAPIIFGEFLRVHPQHGRWPEVLVLDAAPFHGRTTYDDGRPKPSGRHLFSVLGALSSGAGTVDDAADRKSRVARVWQYRACRRVDTSAWTDFFRQMPGRPLYIVCDGDPTLLRAIERRWPGMPVFRCTAHLSIQAKELVRRAGLRETPFGASINERTFTSRHRWEWFRLGLESLEEDGHVGRLSAAKIAHLERLRDWTTTVAPDVDFNLDNDHAPWTTGGLERPLRVVKNSLFDRRFALRNMDRLNHLLVLFQMAQLGVANAHWWSHILYDQHLGYGGRPPPRRRVDNPELWPGVRGGRLPAPEV